MKIYFVFLGKEMINLSICRIYNRDAFTKMKNIF